MGNNCNAGLLVLKPRMLPGHGKTGHLLFIGPLVEESGKGCREERFELRLTKEAGRSGT